MRSLFLLLSPISDTSQLVLEYAPPSDTRKTVTHYLSDKCSTAMATFSFFSCSAFMAASLCRVSVVKFFLHVYRQYIVCVVRWIRARYLSASLEAFI